MIAMNYTEAREFILEKLKRELPPNLYYHGIHHTHDVFESADRIAMMENITGGDLDLLRTAALFHDVGFLIKYKSNEEESAVLAREILPGFDYTHEQIERICRMILSTKIPQAPEDILDQILCDADLDYLGRDDFFTTALKLKREWYDHGMKTTLKEWYLQEYDFLMQHRFFTNSAKALRLEKKKKHLSEIKELLSQ